MLYKSRHDHFVQYGHEKHQAESCHEVWRRFGWPEPLLLGTSNLIISLPRVARDLYEAIMARDPEHFPRPTAEQMQTAGWT